MKIVPIEKRKGRDDYFSELKQIVQENKRKYEPESQKQIRLKNKIKDKIKDKL